MSTTPSTSSSSSSLYEPLLKNATKELASIYILGDENNAADPDDNAACDHNETEDRQSNNDNNSNAVALDWYKSSRIDYRGFIFVIHVKYGLLMLHCTRKKSKPPHYQCPGGHIDNIEFENATKQVLMKMTMMNAKSKKEVEAGAAAEAEKDATITPSNDEKQRIIYLACRAGAARELYEETNIDIRDEVILNERLLPVDLLKKNKKQVCWPNEHKDRFFFVLQVTDEDFYKNNTGIGGGGGIIQRAQGEIGKELKVCSVVGAHVVVCCSFILN